MRHLKSVTVQPKKADLCSTINSDYQAVLCFLLQVLTAVFLPIIEGKGTDAAV